LNVPRSNYWKYLLYSKARVPVSCNNINFDTNIDFPIKLIYLVSYRNVITLTGDTILRRETFETSEAAASKNKRLSISWMGYLKTRAFGPKVNQRSHLAARWTSIAVIRYRHSMAHETSHGDSINVMSSDLTQTRITLPFYGISVICLSAIVQIFENATQFCRSSEPSFDLLRAR